MSSCDAFEIEIDQRLHGALAEPAALEAHLATCASCQAYERSAIATRGALQSAARADAAAVDWDHLKGALRSRVVRDGRLRMALLAFVLVGQTITILIYNAGRPTRGLVTHFVMSAVLLVVVRLVGLVDTWRLRRYERSAGDLLFFRRRWAESRLVYTWVGIVAATLMALVFVADRLVTLVAHGHRYSVGGWLGAIWMACLLLALSAYLFLVRRPLLVREIEAYRA